MNILLIMPRFFNYPQEICEELERMGHSVDFFDDRPSANAFVKAAIRINRNLVKILIDRYFKKIKNAVGDKKYDKVLVISGQSFSFSEEMIKELKAEQNTAEWILYQWDSVENFEYIVKFQKYFDRCYSFDRFDVEKNSKLKFLPLFYTRKYEEIGKENLTEFEHDVMFVGTAHPKKYRFVKEMCEKLKEIYKNNFIYFFFPSVIVYYYRKFKNPEFKNAKKSEFNFVPLKGSDLDKVYKSSKCVLDSAQDNQNGLTIRVLESLGAKKKLITTNSDIANYDFYRPENIYVYSGEFDFNSVFFKSDYIALPEDIYKKYNCRAWLEQLLSGGN